MDIAMEEVIKNIIYIDKSATELRGRMEVEIKERQKKAEIQIERMRIEIVSGMRERVSVEKKYQLEMATSEAEEIVNKGKERAHELLRKFDEVKQVLVMQIFDEII